MASPSSVTLVDCQGLTGIDVRTGTADITFLIGSSYQASQYWMPVVRHLQRQPANRFAVQRLRIVITIGGARRDKDPDEVIADRFLVLGAWLVDGLGHDHVHALGRHDARQARDKMLGQMALVDVANRQYACSANDARINDLGMCQV